MPWLIKAAWCGLGFLGGLVLGFDFGSWHSRPDLGDDAEWRSLER